MESTDQSEVSFETFEHTPILRAIGDFVSVPSCCGHVQVMYSNQRYWVIPGNPMRVIDDTVETEAPTFPACSVRLQHEQRLFVSLPQMIVEVLLAVLQAQFERDGYWQWKSCYMWTHTYGRHRSSLWSNIAIVLHRDRVSIVYYSRTYQPRDRSYQIDDLRLCTYHVDQSGRLTEVDNIVSTRPEHSNERAHWDRFIHAPFRSPQGLELSCGDSVQTPPAFHEHTGIEPMEAHQIPWFPHRYSRLQIRFFRCPPEAPPRPLVLGQLSRRFYNSVSGLHDRDLAESDS